MKGIRFLRTFRTVLLCASFLPAASASEALDMQEGEWEFTTEMTMEGMPFSIPPTKDRQCLTKKDLVPKGEEDKDRNCVVKDQQVSGNTVKWTVICKDKDGTSEGKGTITYSGSNYKGTMKMTQTDKRGNAETMTMKLSGRYLGPCSKETLAAQRERERQISEAEKTGQEAMAKYKKDAEESRRKAEAIIAKVKIPAEDRNACVYNLESPDRNRECDSVMGALNLKGGTWKVEKETATKSAVDKQNSLFMVGDLTSEESYLSPEKPFPRHISFAGCEGEKITVKRSGNKFTWKHKCDYPGKGKTTKEIKGGITFNGNSYEGGIIETLYAGKETTTYYTRLAGKLVKEGRSYTAEKRSYTSSDRQETVSDKAKDASDNPVKSIKKLFGW